MMTPEDVLIEAMAAASLHGDSSTLRQQMCLKLAESMHKMSIYPMYLISSTDSQTDRITLVGDDGSHASCADENCQKCITSGNIIVRASDASR